MLRATVSLSRRASHASSTSEFALSLDGEIMATADDHDAVLERIGELFDLVEEALAREIEDSIQTQPSHPSNPATAQNHQSVTDSETRKTIGSPTQTGRLKGNQR